VRRFRERQKELEMCAAPIPGVSSRDEKRHGLAIFLKQMVEERHSDFSAEAIAAAMKWPKHYPVEVVAKLLAELKASGDYDRIPAEAAS
jgi:hypothetical protein